MLNHFNRSLHSPHKRRTKATVDVSKNVAAKFHLSTYLFLVVAELTTNAKRGFRRIQHYGEYLCINSSDNVLPTIQNSYRVFVICARVHTFQSESANLSVYNIYSEHFTSNHGYRNVDWAPSIAPLFKFT